VRLHARWQRRGPISWLINRSSSFRGRRQSSPGWPEGSQSARPTRATAGGAPAALFLFGLGTWHGGGRIICATTPSPFWRRVRAPLAGGTVPPRSAGAYAARAAPGSSARHADGGSRPQSYLPMQPHPVPSRRRSHICCAHWRLFAADGRAWQPPWRAGGERGALRGCFSLNDPVRDLWSKTVSDFGGRNSGMVRDVILP